MNPQKEQGAQSSPRFAPQDKHNFSAFKLSSFQINDYKKVTEDIYTLKENLRQVHYWLDRFSISREIDHLDNAERHAEAVRPYLPAYLQDLTLDGLYNLYLGFFSSSQADLLKEGE